MNTAPSPGRIILLSANDEGGAAWACELDAPAGRRLIPLGDVAKLAWQSARAAANTAARIQFRPIGDVQAPGGLVYRNHESSAVAPTVDGASFGLGFALVQLSLSWGIAVPAGWSCSAAVDARGVLHPVGRLEAKLRAASLVDVERVLVSIDQDTSRHADVQCVAVATLQDAIALLWPELATWFDANWGTAAKLTELARNLRDLHRQGHAVVSNWRAVADTAARAIELAGPDHPERSSLGRSREVARRHAANAGELQLPNDAELAALCEPDRTDVIADMVQQAADTGCVAPADTLKWANSRRTRFGKDAFPSDLKVLGAMARAAWVLGDGESAVAWAEEVVLGWLAREREQDASRPLAAWLKVAALLGDSLGFDRALHIATKRVQPFCPQRFWLDEAMGVGLAVVQQYSEATERLTAVLRGGDDVFGHVRGSACRYLLAMPEVDVSLRDEALRWLAGDKLGENGRKYCALADLDAALAQGKLGSARSAFEQVLAEERYPMTTVWQAFGGLNELDRLRAVARWYPY